MHHMQIAPLTRGQPFTFAQLCDGYMACYAGRDKYQGMRLEFFVEFFGHKLANEVDGDDVADALDALQQRGRLHYKGGARKREDSIVGTNEPLKPATLNRYRASLAAALTWARKRRLMPKGWTNPVGETARLPEDNARTRYLTEDEYQRLLRVSKLSFWPRLHVLIKLAVTTGQRKGVLMALRWGDIDLEKRRAYVKRTKNGEPFVMVLQQDVCDELNEIKGAAHDDELVFHGRYKDRPKNFEKSWQSALRDAHIEDACFHSLRHTHASWLAMQGVQLLAIADSLGHKSLAMTKRYSHLCVDSRAEMLEKVFSTTTPKE